MAHVGCFTFRFCATPLGTSPEGNVVPVYGMRLIHQHVRSTLNMLLCDDVSIGNLRCHHAIMYRNASPGLTLQLSQAGLPAPPRKKRTVEMAQGKWAEILVHTDRVTKVRNQGSDHDIGQCFALVLIVSHSYGV